MLYLYLEVNTLCKEDIFQNDFISHHPSTPKLTHHHNCSYFKSPISLICFENLCPCNDLFADLLLHWGNIRKCCYIGLFSFIKCAACRLRTTHPNLAFHHGDDDASYIQAQTSLYLQPNTLFPSGFFHHPLY